MNWFTELFRSESVLQGIMIISLVSVVGIGLGKIKIKGIAFGVSFVFFVGIILGHFGFKIDPKLSTFAQSFGLAIFIFSLGLQVGPSFFPSLKTGGLRLNIISIATILLSILVTLILHFVSGISIPDMVGVMCGAVGNSAALGAAQQAIIDMGGSENTARDMALACASAYPYGIIVMILVATFFQYVMKPFHGGAEEESLFEKRQKEYAPILTSVLINNPKAVGKTIAELTSTIDKKMIISLLDRGGNILVPTGETILEMGDKVLLTASYKDEQDLVNELGELVTEDWNHNTALTSRRIFVSREDVNGKTLEQLKIRKLYNVNVTYVNRAGLDLVAAPDLVILMGDRINLVGDKAGIDKVEKMLGNAIKKLNDPNLVPLFIGVVVGLILGSFPIIFEGMKAPVKLGLAGGCITSGILFGAFGYKFKVITFTTQSANLLLRELGLVMFLATLGLNSGDVFFDTLINGNGVKWISFGLLISTIPLIIMGFIMIKFMKMDRASVYGTLCGNMASSQTLPFIQELTGKSSVAVAYSTVYPVTMFIRVLSAQLIITILM